jgi:hypothetical protein
MKLIKGKNANRGFTLTELIVVMGLSIVVLTLMVTMLSIFTAKVDQNRAYHGFYDEVAFCRDEIQEFLSIVDAKDATVKVESNTADGSILSVGSGAKMIQLHGKEFYVKLDAPLEKTYLNYIDRIEFEIFEDSTSSAYRRILKCTFVGSYGKDPAKKEFSQSMIFIVESSEAEFVK